MVPLAPLHRTYYAPDSGGQGRRVLGLLGRDRSFDPEGVRAALGGSPAPSRSCFRAVRAVPPGFVVRRSAEGTLVEVREDPPPANDVGPATPLATLLVDAMAGARIGARENSTVPAVGDCRLDQYRAGLVTESAQVLATPWIG